MPRPKLSLGSNSGSGRTSKKILFLACIRDQLYPGIMHLGLLEARCSAVAGRQK